MVNPSYRWFSLYFFVSISIALIPCAHASQQWSQIAAGIEYRDLSPSALNPWSHIHAFKINLKLNRLSLAMASHLNKKHASVENLAIKNDALIAINGGFFDKKYHPLGLRKSNGKPINALKPISWWGVLYTRNTHAFLSSPSQFINYRNIDFAIQSGPRLIVNGRIPALKPGSAQRTAIGINRPKDTLYIVVTENQALSTSSLAARMKAPPLNCYNALNLDGGSSTQLRVNAPDFHLNVHGFSNVSDAVLVVAR